MRGLRGVGRVWRAAWLVQRRRRCGASEDGRGRGGYRLGHRNQRLRAGGDVDEDLGCCGRPIRSALPAAVTSDRPVSGMPSRAAVHPERRRPEGRHYRHIEDAVAARRSRGHRTVRAPRDRRFGAAGVVEIRPPRALICATLLATDNVRWRRSGHRAGIYVQSSGLAPPMRSMRLAT